jgi:hypothetical protein
LTERSACEAHRDESRLQELGIVQEYGFEAQTLQDGTGIAPDEGEEPDI